MINPSKEQIKDILYFKKQRRVSLIHTSGKWIEIIGRT